MPFTPTHVVAAVPLAHLSARVARWLRPGGGGVEPARAGLPFSALALGSMIPDLPSFVRLYPGAYYTSHSFLGVVTLDLALGLLALLVWHALLARPAQELLPSPIRERLGPAAEPWPWGRLDRWAAAALAIALGAATHVVWDAFTHGDRWGVELVPALRRELLRVSGRGIPVYRALQYGSSLVCLPLLAFLAWRWLARQPRRPRPSPLSSGARVGVWIALLGTPAAVGVAAALLQPTPRRGLRRFMGYAYEAATWGGQALIVGTLAAGALLTLWLARAPRTEPR
ncbi:MAG: DUF4184 family protein [Planctomycetota bacterium]